MSASAEREIGGRKWGFLFNKLSLIKIKKQIDQLIQQVADHVQDDPIFEKYEL